MSIIVRDDGFHDDNLAAATEAGAYLLVPLEEVKAANRAKVEAPFGVIVDNATPAAELVDVFDRADTIHIPFPSFADGRGFSLARQLRALGYQGRLRAVGHVIPDQYPMARRCGFDEVEISDDLAKRAPQDQWLARSDWDRTSYQDVVGRAV
ncbi:DUF934 domain-containing protein [Oceanomicrobium pacificus]|uniref:DUF934 domain-containing protein n=1 Tax=Oceanomicrobium pacificus TaxID=2692916 RepID=A0A6B0TL20_9RHOB|nr:DUF934 domain-containing protein [Oceanomicrobium pacificus]MXU64566.1 DUF934 domain-containing protein [Oceanomicrobium pacificus]